MTSWLELSSNPKFTIENIRTVSEGDHVFEEELKEVWTTEVNEDLRVLEERLKEGNDHPSIMLLVAKVSDSGCVMGAEGVRLVGNEMLRLAGEHRYNDIFPLLTTARREFEEFNLLWGLYRRTWDVSGRKRTFSM